MINSTRIGVSGSRYSIIRRVPGSYIKSIESIEYMIVDCERRSTSDVALILGRGEGQHGVAGSVKVQ